MSVSENCCGSGLGLDAEEDVVSNLKKESQKTR